MKSIYEHKEVLKVSGVLDKTDEGRYIINVEEKDVITQYDAVEILDSIIGHEICITSEEVLR